MTIAEQLIRAKTDLDNVYNAGYEAGKASSSEPTKVTDLTGTVWKFKDTAPSVGGTYNINFISNGNNYTQMKGNITSGTPTSKQLDYRDSDTLLFTTVYGFRGKQVWGNYNYRLVEIAGGTDATNSSLIYALYASAELLSKGSYDDGFANGQNSVLTEFADWSLSTTSNSCTVSITNTHTSLYLHLDFEVSEYVSVDDTYLASVIVPPNSSYSWDSGDWHDSLSGAEWGIYITSMRFSKNGV